VSVLGRIALDRPHSKHTSGSESGVRRGVSVSLVVFAISRVVTFLMAYAISAVSGLSLTDVLTRWDGGWYLAVVQRGYPDAVAEGLGVQAQTTIAFFPGYPLMIKAASSLTGISPAFTGVVISTLTGAAASVVLWLLAARVTDVKSADRTVVLFCFFPAAFVLSMVYAEALFVLLVAGCLLTLMLERWAVAGLAAAFAGLVRPNGLVLTVCCGWAAIQAIRRHGSWRPIIAPLLAPTGTLAFLWYLYLRTGDPLAYVHTQKRGWDQGFDFGVSNVQSAIAIAASRRAEFYVLVIAACLIGIAVALYFLVRWRLPTPLLLYVVGIIGIALGSSNTTSVPRFLLTAFPVLIPIARQLSDNAYPVVVACSAALMATLFWVTSQATWLTP
jgi:xanthosine utilization system XapX-like protein